MGWSAIIAVIALAVALWGWSILRRGWSGRRVGEAPFCRRCGFELTGRSLTDHCPECGADLDARREVVVGVRRPRFFMLFAGMVLLLISVLPIWLVLSGKFQEIKWQEHKPVFWLV